VFPTSFSTPPCCKKICSGRALLCSYAIGDKPTTSPLDGDNSLQKSIKPTWRLFFPDQRTIPSPSIATLGRKTVTPRAPMLCTDRGNGLPCREPLSKHTEKSTLPGNTSAASARLSWTARAANPGEDASLGSVALIVGGTPLADDHKATITRQ